MKLKKEIRRQIIKNYMEIELQSIKKILNRKKKKLCTRSPENYILSSAINRPSSSGITGICYENIRLSVSIKKEVIKSLLYPTLIHILPMKLLKQFFRLTIWLPFLKVSSIFNYKNIFGQYSKKTNLFLRSDIKPNFSACKML